MVDRPFCRCGITTETCPCLFIVSPIYRTDHKAHVFTAFRYRKLLVCGDGCGPVLQGARTRYASMRENRGTFGHVRRTYGATSLQQHHHIDESWAYLPYHDGASPVLLANVVPRIHGAMVAKPATAKPKLLH